MPWRQTRDPYKIWLSEIILQQTRIEQGLNYYLNFVSRFPNVHSLADASEQDILKLWQGLGYYSRARNLHHTAITIANDLNGQFPDNYNDLLKLKGIGEYTAAAISSIAFNEPRPVVDGNVLRFLSRIKGIKTPIDAHTGKKIITDLALKLIDRKQPGEFNQAMMEFGALYCKPQNPNCEDCIFRTECKAYQENQVNSIPIKTKRLSSRKRYFHYLFIIYKNKSVYLRKRTGQDIWKNLYDFPLLEKNHKISQEKMVEEVTSYLAAESKNNAQVTISKEYKHILTHQIISARFYTIRLNDSKYFRKNKFIEWQHLGFCRIKKYPSISCTKVDRKIFEK